MAPLAAHAAARPGPRCGSSCRRPSRPHTTELLLCAHHYRVSRAALAAAKAIVRELPGTPGDIATWIGLELADVPSRAA